MPKPAIPDKIFMTLAFRAIYSEFAESGNHYEGQWIDQDSQCLAAQGVFFVGRVLKLATALIGSVF